MRYTHGGDIYSHGEDILDFSVSLNPLGTPNEVIEAGMESLKHPDVYPDMYCRKLRQAIAEHTGTQPDNIICGCGAAELIYNVVLALKPKKALIAVPAFSEYESALDTAGCKKLFYYLKEENGFKCEYDILDLIDDKTDMVFICSPGNPSGVCIDTELSEKIAQKCRFLVQDECFMDFVYDKRYSALPLTSKYKNILLLRSFTKMYAMPSVRLGYAVCTDIGVTEAMYRCRQPWSVSSAAQAMGVAALKCRDLPERTRRYVGAEREFLAGRLKAYGIKVFLSEANYLLLKCSLDLYGYLMEQGILIRDCCDYRGLKKGFYRIAVRTHEDNLRLVEAVGRRFDG